jgi:hypothetical protein
MNAHDPYRPPLTPDAEPGPRAGAGHGVVPPDVVRLLGQTKPWVRFMSVLGFIGTGLMALLGIVVMIAGGLGDKVPAAMGLVYVVFGAIYIAPSIFLGRYAGSIARLVVDGSMESLGEAMGHQKSFWKFVGLLTAILLGLYAVILVIALVVGIGAAVLGAGK